MCNDCSDQIIAVKNTITVIMSEITPEINEIDGFLSFLSSVSIKFFYVYKVVYYS